MKTGQYEQAIERIHDRVGESVTRQIPTLDYIMNVADMSPTDKLFFDAYKKYGIRNHTWQDFKDMFKGDLEAMNKTVRHWKTWDEINELSQQLEGLQTKVKELLKKYNVHSISDKEREEYRTLYPDLVTAYDEFIKVNTATLPNYRTFNSQIDRLEREFERKSKSIPKEDKQAKLDLVAEYITKMDDLIDLRNADYVVAERVEKYREIILNNPTILKMGSRFDKLSGTEKIDLARMILNESAKAHGTPVGRVVQDDAENGPHVLKGEQIGGYARENGHFVLKSDACSNLFEFLRVLAHEDAHRIDYYNPSYGMIGDQLMKFVEENYRNNKDIDMALYKKFATEQSSYYLDKTVAAALKYIIDNSNSGE